MVTVSVQFKRSEDPLYAAMFFKATQMMSSVLSSPMFLVNLTHEYEETKGWEGETSVYKGASPEIIFCNLTTSTGQIDLMVETYHTWKNVIGYGLPNDTIIRVNKKYLDKYKLESREDMIAVGSNLLHEHGHDMGFEHDFLSTKKRPNSICYSLNRVYTKTAIEYYEIKPKVFAPKKPWWRVW